MVRKYPSVRWREWKNCQSHRRNSICQSRQNQPTQRETSRNDQ